MDVAANTAIQSSFVALQPAHARELLLDVVTDYQGLLRLEDQWNKLMLEVGETSPFVTHAWTCAWWEAFAADSQLHVLILRKGDRICGLAPLMFSRVRRYGMSIRRLGTLYNLHVQRTSFLVHDDCRDEFLQLFWKHVRSVAPAWDVLELSPFDRLSPTLPLIEAAAAGSRLPIQYWTEGHSPFLSIAGTWDTYLKTLSNNRRGNFLRQFKKLAELGEVEVELVTGGDALDAALQDGYRIEAMGWKGTQGTAIGSDPTLSAFYASLAARMAATDGLRLYFLRVGGRRIAFQYCVETKDRLYVLKPGYDPEFARFSPSQLLAWRVLESAFARGIVEYDFLGGADDWKLVWAKEKREIVWMLVYARTLRGRLLRLLKVHVAPWLREVRQRLPQSFQRPGTLVGPTK